MEDVQISEQADLDNAQIVENIEIVVENGKSYPLFYFISLVDLKLA